jgi:imidazolonepropionase-like amidohydrolase
MGLVCALALNACSGEPVSTMSQTQAITGATALLGDAQTPVTDAVVLIEGTSIVAAGTHEEVPIPEGARVIDASGATLVPGFIDAHVHIGFYEPSEILEGGVTTVRDLAWPPALIAELVQRSAADGYDGPTIIAAGPMLTAPGGYPTKAGWAPPGTGVEVAAPGDALAAVNAVADEGFAIVKVALNPPVGPVLDRATLSAIVDAAHERGLKVTGHIWGLSELEKAIDAGVDELAHMLMSNEPLPRRTIERMIDARMTIVPTLSIFAGAELRTAISNLYEFRKAGGSVIYGTDLGNAGPRPGIDAQEVSAMSQAGMTPLEIIRSATFDAAAYLGLTSVGHISVGMDADLVLLQGSPLEDVRDLTRVSMVWRRGTLREK